MDSKADFNKRVKEVIFPVFPLLADDFLQQSGIKEGICLDIGTGNGYMGLALAEKSDLNVRLIDVNTEILEFAEENIKARQLSDRVETLLANVEALPFRDNYAKLIVSRGSVFFLGGSGQGI
jgi:ubiquinone/menaquinone biosynthesis C-methylase UbiE